MSIQRYEVDGSLEPSRGYGTEVVLADEAEAHEAAAVAAAEQRTRKQAARDLREWIFNTYPSIKGYADIDVDAALNIVEGP